MLSWEGGFGENRHKNRPPVVKEDSSSGVSTQTKSKFIHHATKFNHHQSELEDSVGDAWHTHHSKSNEHETALMGYGDAGKDAISTLGRYNYYDKTPKHEAKAMAGHIYDTHKLKEKLRGATAFTIPHAKGLLDAVAHHRKSATEASSRGDYSGYKYHSKHANIYETEFNDTYKEHSHNIRDSHESGDYTAVKPIFAGFSKKNAPTMTPARGERATFLGTPKRPIRVKEKHAEDWLNETKFHERKKTVQNPHGYNHHEIHVHKDVLPSLLSGPHRETINDYTRSGSSNMNGYLRHRAGDPTGNPGYGADQHDLNERRIRTLSSAFTKGNTNRIDVHTWSGVPEHVGKDLMNSPQGSSHHIAGFTSTSTSKATANEFAVSQPLPPVKARPRHIIHYKVKAGAGLSIANMSTFSENEVVLHHGAKIKYHGTSIYKGNGEHGDIHVHHVTAYPEHIPLERYGPIATHHAPRQAAPKKATPKQKAETDYLAKELEGHY